MSVADKLPYYFRLANTLALLIEEPLQLCFPHSTPQHNTRPSFQRPTQLRPNWPVPSVHTMAASQVHSTATESFALTRSLRDCPLYPVYTCCFKTILLSRHVRQYYTYGNAPPQVSPRKPTHISSIADESGSRASPATLL